MTATFALPAALVVALVSLMGLVDWRLRPRLAMPMLAGAMAAASGAFLVIVFGAAAGFALGPVRSSASMAWCQAIPLHHQVEPLVGIAASGASVAAAFRIGRILLARRRTVRSINQGDRFSIVESTDRFAYAVPTHEGCVVVSTGLLNSLSTAERRAVFAHERAHLQLGHHHFTLTAELAVAALPTLRPMANQLRHATERAADEAAARSVQDRSVVARAITHAVLGPAAGGLSSLGGGSVPRRVEALLWPQREKLASRRTSLAATSLIAMAVLGLVMQLHHFGELINHLCSATS